MKSVAILDIDVHMQGLHLCMRRKASLCEIDKTWGEMLQRSERCTSGISKSFHTSFIFIFQTLPDQWKGAKMILNSQFKLAKSLNYWMTFNEFCQPWAKTCWSGAKGLSIGGPKLCIKKSGRDELKLQPNRSITSPLLNVRISGGGVLAWPNSILFPTLNQHFGREEFHK